MDTWYFPVTMLPGIALLVLSTSAILTALSSEIDLRIRENANKLITRRKLRQLYLLNFALAGLYIGIGFMLMAGLFYALVNLLNIPEFLGSLVLLLGVLTVLFSIICLILYSQRAVKIRQDQFNDQ